MNDQESEHQNCHSEKAASNKSDEDCGNICQTETLIKSDSKSLDLKTFDSQIAQTLFKTDFYFIDHNLLLTIKSHDPPGAGFFHGLPLFIQKSSYII